MKNIKVWLSVGLALLLCMPFVMGAVIDDLQGIIQACFPLESDGSDSTGNITTLAEVGVQNFSTGIIGNAVRVDPSTSLNGDLSPVLANVGAITLWTKPYIDRVHGQKFISVYEDADNVFHLQDHTSSEIYWNWYDGASHMTFNFYIPRYKNNWEFITMNFNGSATATNGLRYYYNKTLDISNALAGVLDTGYDEFYIGSDHDGGDGVDAQIDEVMVWARALTGAENIYLIDNLVSCADLVPAPVISPVLDLVFVNGSGDKKVIFDEGENFFVWANYTLNNGSVLSDGECNITLFGGIVEVEGVDDNFTLCGAGCDYSEFKEEFDLGKNYSAVNDSVHFRACYEVNQPGDVSMVFNCSTGAETFILDSLLFPDCDAGLSSIFVDSVACLGSEKVNISFEYSEVISKRKRIEDLDYDREYTAEINEFGVDVSFNTTLGVFTADHSHEYYKHGPKSISANCTHANPLYPLDYSENITIVNVLPRVFINGVLINGSLYPLSSPFNFLAGTWDFLVSVSDDDLTLVNITLSNKTGIVKSVQAVNVSDFLVNSSSFRDFSANPFNFSVQASDSVGVVNVSVLFNVSDVTAPTCTGFGDATIDNNSNYTWSANCVDESFFSFMINCTDGYGFMQVGLNVQSYNFNKSHVFIKDSICIVEVWDGHTANILSDSFKDIDLKDNKDLVIFPDTHRLILSPVTDRDGATLSVIEKGDRLGVVVDYGVLDSKAPIRRTFHYTTGPDSYYFPDSPYDGHIVDFTSKTWADFNIDGDPESFVVVNRLNISTWAVEVYSKKGKIEFNSIGQLNNNSYTFAIDTFVFVPFALFTNFDNIGQALTYLFLGFLWVVFLVLTATLKGPTDNRIQLFNIAQLFTGLVLGVGLFYFSFVMGMLILCLSAFIFYAFTLN